MKDIRGLVKEHPISDVRDALYYLSRYLKQASFYDEYGKDIFEDDMSSLPSSSVKSLTLSLIKYIEETEGKSVSGFSDGEYIAWMDHISDVEKKLDPNPSQSQIELAEKLISELVLPTNQNNK